MTLKLVIFDLDGTVVENYYDWPSIRKELGVEAGSILAYLDGLPEPLRSEKYELLERHERRQTEKAVLKPGIASFLKWLKASGFSTALVTNNNLANTRLLLSRFQLNFDQILTRESGLHKPTGAPLLKVMEDSKVRPEETVVIGDTNYDLVAAREAGVQFIFILKSSMTPEDLEGVDLVESFEQIREKLINLMKRDPFS